MNIPLDKAQRHCQALAEMHTTVTGSSWLKEYSKRWGRTEDDFESAIAEVFDTYFNAIEATPSERAELGL